MILFGTAVTDTETYERCAIPGIRRAAETDSVVIAHHTAGSVFRNYNLLLDKAAEHENLEALVLIHQDAEIADADFAAKIRETLRDPDVAVIGCAGAVGVRSIAWWQGALEWAGLTHRYPEYGGGDFPALSWHPETIPSYASPGEVDSIDGFLIVLSPWAVRELRFDESLGKLHGYDFDICMQAKAAGKKVATADVRAIHHHSLDLIKDPETWIQTYIRLVEKWEDLLPDSGAPPRQRALRAEAEAACARALMVSWQMREQAAKRQLDRVKRDLDWTEGQLEARTHELEMARGEPEAQRGEGSPAQSSEEPGNASGKGEGKFAAIDYGVDELGIEKFASLEIGQRCGQYAFYAIEKPTVRQGLLLDVSRRSGNHLLNTIEQAAERPGMLVLDRDFADPDTVAEIGQVDAVLLYDVLVRMAQPDWSQVLEVYAAITSCFVIANPQWEEGETVRLLDLGREAYLTTVPPWPGHREIFDRLDEWYGSQRRRYRDGTHVWQWGITDDQLAGKMDELGFELKREWRLNPPPETRGFINKAFVFNRPHAAPVAQTEE